jgi:hypothetical protein
LAELTGPNGRQPLLVVVESFAEATAVRGLLPDADLHFVHLKPREAAESAPDEAFREAWERPNNHEAIRQEFVDAANILAEASIAELVSLMKGWPKEQTLLQDLAAVLASRLANMLVTSRTMFGLLAHSERIKARGIIFSSVDHISQGALQLIEARGRQPIAAAVLAKGQLLRFPNPSTTDAAECFEPDEALRSLAVSARKAQAAGANLADAADLPHQSLILVVNGGRPDQKGLANRFLCSMDSRQPRSVLFLDPAALPPDEAPPPGEIHLGKLRNTYRVDRADSPAMRHLADIVSRRATSVLPWFPRGQLAYNLYRFLSIDVAQIIALNAAIVGLFAKAKPCAVVYAPGSPALMTLVDLVARNAGARTVEIPPTLTIPKAGFVSGRADVVGLTCSPLVKMFRGAFPEGAERYVAVGSPYLDDSLATWTATGASASVIRQMYGFGDDPVVMLATENYGPEVLEESVKVCLEVLEREPRARLLMRPHPGEPEFLQERIRRMIAGSPVSGRVIFSRFSLLDDISAANVVMVFFSAVALYALALDKPVLAFAPAGMRVPLNYETWGAARFTNDPDTAVHVLRDFLADGPAAQMLAEQRRAFLAAEPALTSQDSLQRICAHLMEDCRLEASAK